MLATITQLPILQLLQYTACTMQHEQLRAGRLQAGLTQKQAAKRLGVSQPYLSQLEKGERPVTAELASSATALYRLPATALPLPEALAEESKVDDTLLARQLSALGYPGFAHLRPRKANPAAVVLAALLRNDLETRLAEALPWVLLTYPELDWFWLIRHAKLQDMQNRLGFLVAVAKNLTADKPESQSAFNQLCTAERQLERARLAREDTLCRESMPTAERHWLGANRSSLARHWNLLTGLTADQLSYAR
ncbi:MAG TPA: helix-turn-helix transcriptional regulator [Steroidobacteraceae bacterium]|nr:helix-turn-helix transcriptional regulator [Steroidobacteraceae bacterium]